MVRAADGAVTGRYELAEKVRGATVTKEITLRPGHPLVYQRHILAGGDGADLARAPRDDPRARRRAALLLAQGLRGDA